jgi:uncharacterized protein
MLQAEAKSLNGARAARASMMQHLVATPTARWSVKIIAMSAGGIVAVYLYSNAMQFNAGIDGTLLALIIFGAAAVSSIGGFAFSALCGAVLFHTEMDHVQVVQTMLVSSIGIQCLMIATMWRMIDWLRLRRFLIGGMIGVPLGLFILLHVERHLFSWGVGTLLSAYSAYMILRRPFVVSRRLDRLDLLIGFAGGIAGGAVAFPGAPVTAWCQLKGWTRDQQRGIYQPFILVMQIASLAVMALLSDGDGRLKLSLSHVMLVPPALVGALIGIYIYHRCTDRLFLIVVNAMLFFSGLTLLF